MNRDELKTNKIQYYIKFLLWYYGKKQSERKETASVIKLSKIIAMHYRRRIEIQEYCRTIGYLLYKILIRNTGFLFLNIKLIRILRTEMEY